MPRPMLYGRCLHGYVPYICGLRSCPIEWIIQQITLRENRLTFYRILPIIHAYNAGISRLRSYARLHSYARLRLKDVTPVGRYDSGRISRFWSHFPILDVTTQYICGQLLQLARHSGCFVLFTGKNVNTDLDQP
jgi:hypothetical protein